jgi:capsular exopolysaccharide synthesis family protein
MGRLDRAMRRAAEEQATPGASATADRELMDIRDLQTDVFPSETPGEPAGSVVDLPLAVDPAEGDIETLENAAVAGAESAPLPGPPQSRMLSNLKQHVNATLETKTVIDDHMMPVSREQYRRLAAAFHQAQRTSGAKVAMVASAVQGEGKSLTAANLALTMSESYRKNVLLIDADLRRPTQHSIFQIPGAPGLSDGLVSIDEPRLPLHRLSARLTILPAGRPTSDPIGAITSERMRRLIDEAREVFDWIIIDTPPVGLLTDAALMSSMADGVVLVVKAESTPHDLVARAVDALGRERMLGVVLNRATEHAHGAGYDYYKYYGPSSQAVARR